MNIPEWTKPAVWGAIIGAIGVTVFSLSMGWLVTSSSATLQAQNKADKAVIAALTPVCVARFKEVAEAQQGQHLAALEEESRYQQDDYVADQGWATLPGQEEPNDDVAEACAEQLLAASSEAEG